MSGRFVLPYATAFDDNGNPIANARLYFYKTGTSQPEDTYSDAGLTILNPNPVLANAAGRFGDIFLKPVDYKVVLTDANDAQIWTADPVRSLAPKPSTVKTVTTTYQIQQGDDGLLIAADATNGAFVVTLPALATAGNGFEAIVQKVDASSNVVTVDGAGSDKINGNADVPLPDQWSAVSLRSNGARWLAYTVTPSIANRILPPNYISGFLPSNDGTSGVRYTEGKCRDQLDSFNIITTQDLTKLINASFAEGNNQGGLDTGTVAADEVYNVYAIAKPDDTADICFSLKSSGLTLPSGFTKQRLIGRIETDASSNIVQNSFMQVKIDGDHSYHEVATASGSEAFIRGLPDGPDWLDIGADNVSSTSTASLEMQGGNDSTMQASGYLGNTNTGVGNTAWSTAALLNGGVAAGGQSYGSYRAGISSVGADEYHMDGTSALPGAAQHQSAGFLKLDGKILSRLRFAPSAGDFDGGKITVRTFRMNID